MEQLKRRKKITPEVALLSTKIFFGDHIIYIRLPHNYFKVVSDRQKIHQKVFFSPDIYIFLRPIFYQIPYYNVQNLPTPEVKGLERKETVLEMAWPKE